MPSFGFQQISLAYDWLTSWLVGKPIMAYGKEKCNFQNVTPKLSWHIQIKKKNKKKKIMLNKGYSTAVPFCITDSCVPTHWIDDKSSCWCCSCRCCCYCWYWWCDWDWWCYTIWQLELYNILIHTSCCFQSWHEQTQNTHTYNIQHTLAVACSAQL